jgi:hypothetical protein
MVRNFKNLKIYLGKFWVNQKITIKVSNIYNQKITTALSSKIHKI